MTKMRLMQAVCTVALLAAAPAFAQTNTAPNSSGYGNTSNTPSDTMSPSDHTGSMHRMHDADMGRSGRSMHSRADSSQDSAVDQLNSQSLQAARSGQAFNAGGSSSGMMSPSGSSGSSGSMNDMSGGSMNSNGSMGGNGSMGNNGSMSNSPAR